ncbi:MAG: hypothetical protein H7A32_05895 [Deltaproteobacteria bacterium]|nr:hypothetical protein [Deltaproteobacteria bacterium]
MNFTESFIYLSFFFIRRDKIESLKVQGTDPIYKQNKAQGDLYTAAQPDSKSFAEFKKMGIKTIINLRGQDEMKFAEEKIVQDQQMKYVHIPVSPATLDLKTVNEFSQYLAKPENYPILVHCSSANRAATMVALDEIIRNQQDVEAEIQKASQYGITKDALKDKIREVAASKDKKAE